MEFLTLEINPPEQIKPILAKKCGKWIGLAPTYTVIDLDLELSDIEVLHSEISNSGGLWAYIEDSDNED